MAAGSIIVKDLDALDRFGAYLSACYEQLGELCSHLEGACAAQADNWQDEQYADAKADIDTFVRACRSELENLNTSAQSVACIVRKLRDV